jgi:hypothetical protein
MAVNEIRASAKETGMRFWEYGIEIFYSFLDRLNFFFLIYYS